MGIDARVRKLEHAEGTGESPKAVVTTDLARQTSDMKGIEA